MSVAMPWMDEGRPAVGLPVMVSAHAEPGVDASRADVLVQLLTLRFGPLPPWALTRLLRAGPDTLATWVSRLPTAKSLDQILGA